MKELDEQYNRIAKEFSDIHGGQNRANIKAWHKFVDFSLEGRKLLDLGFGTGDDLSIFVGRGAEVSGIDASKEMLSIAEKKLPNANLKLGSFEELPFDDNYFDVVVSKYSIQHSEALEKIWSEASRVLKRGGHFVFLVTHPMRQFIERKQEKENYFEQKVVDSLIFDEKIVVKEPTHTFNEYLSDNFLDMFNLLRYEEIHDPAAEKIGGATYPGFFIAKAKKR